MGRRNGAALEGTIRALRNGGRLEAVDAATVALARTLAHALDVVDPEDSPAQLASVARAHLATLKLLRGVVDDDVGAFEDLLAHLQSPMGDAPES